MSRVKGKPSYKFKVNDKVTISSEAAGVYLCKLQGKIIGRYYSIKDSSISNYYRVDFGKDKNGYLMCDYFWEYDCIPKSIRLK